MREYRLALLGFGNVGQGLAEIIHDRGEEIASRFGAKLLIVAVSDIQKGAIYNPTGIDPQVLLAAAGAGQRMDAIQGFAHDWDALTTIQQSNANVIAEMTYTDLHTGEPATSHIIAALRAGKHVVTSNKGPTALRYHELTHIAEENGVCLGVEGTVMSGTPTLHLGMDLLAAADIRKMQGILNGTTNYILTQMGAGASYQAALSEAQRLGYAEADPRGDVEGFDAAGKVVIIANLLMGANLGMQDVERQGITHLTQQDIADARAQGEKWKLIGKVEKVGNEVLASVKPQRLPLAHPLASVDGATNAITYSTSLLGDVTLIGPGAGRTATGYALILELLAIHRQTS